MAEKFDKKAGMRANWLIENHKLVSQVNTEFFSCFL